MQVFKFGGASVKNAEAIENVALLMRQYAPAQVIVVVSAMGKTTNALENVWRSWHAHDGTQHALLGENKRFHLDILQQLFADKAHPVFAKIDALFDRLAAAVANPPSGNADYDYDQLVSYGELISTTIIGEYLCAQGMNCRWCDVRKLIITDSTWREGNVDWAATEQAIQREANRFFENDGTQKILLTQGFLGGTHDGHTTTLGREGSDYTAAIFSYALHADEMTVWKDVSGVLNADPKLFADTVLLPHISYGEAIELTYYGATVIHPKTIKPLQNKQIPMRVRSFLHPNTAGTSITPTAETETSVPSYIVKNDQLLISISPKNFSFIAERNLSDIFAAFAQAGIRINMMQNSAISFTACMAEDAHKTEKLFAALEANFTIKYNSPVQLITIRHWTPAAIDKMIACKTVLLEQRNRTTAQMVVK